MNYMKHLRSSQSSLSILPPRRSCIRQRPKAPTDLLSLSTSSLQSRVSPGTTLASTAAVTRRSARTKTGNASFAGSCEPQIEEAKPVHLPHAKAHSFCIWENGIYTDLRGKRINREISTYFEQVRMPMRDHAQELRQLAEQTVSLAQMDKKYMKQVKLRPAYDHPQAKEFFGAVREANVAAAMDMASRYPSLLNTLDYVPVTQVEETPLHVAVKAKSLELTSFFVDKGISYESKDMAGRTPYKTAKRKNMHRITGYMTHHKNMRRRKVLLVTGLEKRTEHQYKILNFLKGAENLVL